MITTNVSLVKLTEMPQLVPVLMDMLISTELVKLVLITVSLVPDPELTVFPVNPQESMSHIVLVHMDTMMTDPTVPIVHLVTINVLDVKAVLTTVPSVTPTDKESQPVAVELV